MLDIEHISALDWKVYRCCLCSNVCRLARNIWGSSTSRRWSCEWEHCLDISLGSCDRHLCPVSLTCHCCKVYFLFPCAVFYAQVPRMKHLHMYSLLLSFFSAWNLLVLTQFVRDESSQSHRPHCSLTSRQRSICKIVLQMRFWNPFVLCLWCAGKDVNKNPPIIPMTRQ